MTSCLLFFNLGKFLFTEHPPFNNQ